MGMPSRRGSRGKEREDVIGAVGGRGGRMVKTLIVPFRMYTIQEQNFCEWLVVY